MSQIIIIIVTMSILLVSGFTFLDNYIGSATASKQAEELQAVMDEVQLYKTVTKGNFEGLTIENTGLITEAVAVGQSIVFEGGATAAEGQNLYPMDTVEGMYVSVDEGPAPTSALIEVGVDASKDINPVILNKVETKWQADQGYVVTNTNSVAADGIYTLAIK
jgi:hypothetical protein